MASAAPRSFVPSGRQGAHAVLRDEGDHYNPELVSLCYHFTRDLFSRKFGEGDRTDAAVETGPAETRH